jgi:hypothetical protein
MLTAQQQQQLLLQAQAHGNMSSSGSPLLSDTDPRRLRMLLSRSGLTAKDGQSTASSDLSQGVGSPLQAASPLARGTPQDQAQTELLMKVIYTWSNQRKQSLRLGVPKGVGYK